MRGVHQVCSGAFFLAMLAGCPQSSTTTLDASATDTQATMDSDHDGVCDGTEAQHGTNPLSWDSDGDGLPDFYEIRFNYDPLSPASPERDRLLFLRQSSSEMIQLSIEQTVRGQGDNYAGAFEALPAFRDTRADTFFTDAVALSAIPIENVAVIETDAERFLDVVGRTVLIFEVRFAFGDAPLSECTEAYPFRYQIRTEQGSILNAPRYLLIVPAGTSWEDSPWCVPAECI